jgi:hypothetical protein
MSRRLLVSLIVAVVAAFAGLLTWHPIPSHVSVVSSPSAKSSTALVAILQTDSINKDSAKAQSPSDKQDALDIDGIWRLAALKPRAMADHLPGWLPLLMGDHKFADVEGLSLLAIVENAWDTSTVCAYQEARVRALLAEGRYEQALPEAKAYYNVAALSQTSIAVDLVALALAKTAGPAAAEQFKDQQETGKSFPVPAAIIRENGLKSIKIDGSRLHDLIDQTTHGSRYKFANQISQGNLLLLSDQPAEAIKSFTKACDYAQENRDLSEALRGIARSVRDMDGSLGRARELIDLLKTEKSTASVGINLPNTLDKEQLRSAAMAINLSDVPFRMELAMPSGGSRQIALPPPDSQLPSFQLPMNDSILLARLAPQSDPELRNWLDRWQRNTSLGISVDEKQNEELVKTLNQSKLPLSTLLDIAEAFQANGGDTNSLAAWLSGCTGQSDPRLADWLNNWRMMLLAGRSPSDSERWKLAAITRDGVFSCESLVQVGQLVNAASRDFKTTAVIFSAAISHGHQQLSAFSHFSDKMKPVLAAMTKCGDVFWETVDAGDPQCIGAMWTVSGDVEKWVPRNDAALEWAVPWAAIGRAECLFLWGKTDQSLSAAASINLAGLDRNQRSGVAWIYGLDLYRESRFSEAAKQFRIVATNAGYKNAEGAERLVIASLARNGQTAEANKEFDKWARRYRPRVQDAALLLACIDGKSKY